MFDNSLKSAGLGEAGNAPATSAAASTPSVTPISGGRIVHDVRGNAVFDWDVATAVLAGSKSAELLRMLDNPMLALEGHEFSGEGEWAGDPYNRR
ncbi:MAG TPA: hypothetical protein VHB68_11435 [Steroidobacteraceae bacterium]|nr:hypothetical protein [Steroidobacteraceae bacterium]